jgi:hypothetical protein
MRWPRLRGRNHRLSSAAKSFAVAMTLIATLAQFFALSHEVTVRHYRCAEHGELTHIAATSGEFLLPVPRLTDAVRRGETDAPDAHEHCAAAFTICGGSSLPFVGGAARLAPPPQDRPPPLPPLVRDRLFVLASAPKTSPPAVCS